MAYLHDPYSRSVDYKLWLSAGPRSKLSGLDQDQENLKISDQAAPSVTLNLKFRQFKSIPGAKRTNNRRKISQSIRRCISRWFAKDLIIIWLDARYDAVSLMWSEPNSAS